MQNPSGNNPFQFESLTLMGKKLRNSQAAGLASRVLLSVGIIIENHALALANRLDSAAHCDRPASVSAFLGQSGYTMVWVPPGPFLMGSDKIKDAEVYDNECPKHKVILSGYWIGRFPVTVAQFRSFMQESGYRPKLQVRLAEADDHPVTNVTWRDAIACCRWLGEKTGVPVTLPSEAEWEKAARGTDRRIYPWGNEPPDESRCNFDCRMGETTPVGSYSPQGDSPYGCADMAGNVWEWCRSKYAQYPYKEDDGREAIDQDTTARVVRGGSFFNDRRYMRCAFRARGAPGFRDVRGGFRVVMAGRPMVEASAHITPPIVEG